MKNLLFISVISCIFSVLISCDSVDENVLTNNTSSRFIKSSVSNFDYSDFVLHSYKEFGPRKSPGAMSFTEDDAHELMKPFIEDGQHIKQQLLNDIQNYPNDYTEDDIQAVINTSDADMAVISFILYQLQSAQTENNSNDLDITNILDGNIEPIYEKETNYDLIDGLQIPWRRVWSCVYTVFGGKSAYNFIKSGINGTMTATTLVKFISKTATKYLGYLGAFIAVCDFMDCMDWTNLRIEEKLKNQVEHSVNDLLK